MTMVEDFKRFLTMLLQATARIERHYFQLPVAGREEPIYRERVYCYELYHHIRQLMPDGYEYVLDGEVDKAGHPVIREQLGSVKPDFIVHVPGTMNRNLAVIEVKAVNADEESISKDLATLRSFLEKAGYFRAIYLVYGYSWDSFTKFTNATAKKSRDPHRERIVLVMHRRPMKRAIVIR